MLCSCNVLKKSHIYSLQMHHNLHQRVGHSGEICAKGDHSHMVIDGLSLCPHLYEELRIDVSSRNPTSKLFFNEAI